jgi:hypothetical protein
MTPSSQIRRELKRCCGHVFNLPFIPLGKFIVCVAGSFVIRRVRFGFFDLLPMKEIVQVQRASPEGLLGSL